MAGGRTLKSLVSRRRRVGDEGEDEEGPVIVDDSQSEGSILSEGDDDEVSSVGGEPSAAGPTGDAAESAEANSKAATNGSKPAKKTRKQRKKGKKVKEQASTDTPPPQAIFKAVADTDAMMNGLRIDDQGQAQEAVEFESMGPDGLSDTAAQVTAAPLPANGSSDTPAQRPRREFEDPKRKRDVDPPFNVARGNYFMHDTRGQSNGKPIPPARGAWSERGRGRGGPPTGGPFSPAAQMAQAERAAEKPWKHDLHDSINMGTTPLPAKAVDSPFKDEQEESARLFSKPAPPPAQSQPRVLSFSSTTLVGKVQIRVLLPGMKAAIAFSEVPWKHYVRLPNHRPPLRRDKPVRISLPDRAPQYIFPSPERSFIFIPRQNRPNQNRYHHGSFQRSIGGYGYSSRRTSMYGGSMYASSVAASRRSSIAGISRADAFSPTSFGSGMPPANRPVVRLPHGGPHFSAVTTPSGPLSGQHTPTGVPQIHTYPLPQQPAFQGTPTSTVHQPRPQKAISVTGIESPALLQQQNGPSSTELPPFQNQLPAHMTEPPPPPPSLGYHSPRQPYASFPPQPPPNGTPLGGIPEQAVHAPSFQPPAMSPYGHGAYYPPYVPQQQYYYSPPGPNGYPPAMPMYVPPQGYDAMPPTAQSMPAPQPPPSQGPGDVGPPPPHSQGGAGVGQSSMMAHESNGMVFYVPRSDLEQQQQEGQNYQPAESFVPSYAMPGLPPPTPAPETSGYYYAPVPAPMYYPAPRGTQP